MAVIRFPGAGVRFFTGRSLIHRTRVNAGASRAPPEDGHGRAPASPVGRRVGERDDERRAGEGCPDDAALDPGAPAVDDPDLGEAARRGRLHVVGDDGGRLGGPERVEVEGVLDRDLDGGRGRPGSVGRAVTALSHPPSLSV